MAVRAWPTLAAALIVSGVLAAPAHALKHVTPVIEFAGSNGYDVTVTGVRGQVNIGLYRNDLGASYTVDGAVGRRALDADFGEFGSVHVHFVQQRGPRIRQIRPPGCEGTMTIRRGQFNGPIEFTSEAGQTSFSSTSIPGKVVALRVRCPPGEPPEFDPGDSPDESNAVALDAYAGSRFGQQGTFFNALRYDRRGAVSYSAGETHSVGAVSVSNYGSSRAPRSTFRLNRNLRAARVTPPTPFSGSASFSKPKGGDATWTGDLVVTLPSGPVALAGPGFRASISEVTAYTVGLRLIDSARAALRQVLAP
jgi:hypothetical protein